MTTPGPLLLSRSGTDRDGDRRVEPGLLQTLWSDPATRVLRVRDDGTAPLREHEGGLVLDLLPPAQVAPSLPGGTSEPGEQGEPGEPVVYLGTDPAGTAYLAVAVPDEVEARDGAGRPPAAQDGRWGGLRQVAAELDDTSTGLLVTAVALLNWHRVHGHCPRCGARTRVESAGWTRRCPVDGSEHYPRTDAAVIMTVVDDADRLLLARNALWPQGRYSTLAGFVEPGEPLEASVRREVHEEVAVTVGDVEYRGSQPWPFPASLMVGFTARATSTDIRVDGEEIADARWFSRQELARAVEREEVLLPPGASIARWLVEQWYGGSLGPDGAWR